MKPTIENGNRETQKYEWFVYSTALAQGWLMLYCQNTGSTGTVRNPSESEWKAAFHAPGNPYRWLDESRVVIDMKRTKRIETYDGRAVGKMFILDDSPRIACPFNGSEGPCDAVPHITGSMTGRGFPAASTSGNGLIVTFECENGHEWILRLVDHSGSLWIGTTKLITEEP